MLSIGNSIKNIFEKLFVAINEHFKLICNIYSGDFCIAIEICFNLEFTTSNFFSNNHNFLSKFERGLIDIRKADSLKINGYVFIGNCE